MSGMPDFTIGKGAILNYGIILVTYVYGNDTGLNGRFTDLG